MSVKWKVSTTQTDETKWRDQDLQTAEISLTTNTSTKITTGSATMKHRMGLAKINMKTWSNVKNVLFYIAAPAAVKDVNYTWDNQAYTNVTSSSTYTSTAKPWQNTTHWYVMDANTEFTTSATTTGVASYSGQGVASATAADVRNNNSWTTTLTYTSGNCVDFTPTITATNYLSRIPYTMAYGDALYSDGALSKTGSGQFWSGRTAIAYVSTIGTKGSDKTAHPHGYAISIRRHPTLYLWQNAYADSPLPNIATSSYASDFNGYSNTQTLSSVSNAATVYPAAYAAWTYTAKNKANNGNVSLSGNLASSHWFLPSSGQVNDVVKNIGGVTASPTIIATAVNWIYNYVSTSFIDGVNAVLNKFISNGGYTMSAIPKKYGSPDYSGKGGESTWWTSTEINNEYCYLLIVWQTNQLYFCEISDHGDSDTKRGDSHSVWPCIAF